MSLDESVKVHSSIDSMSTLIPGARLLIDEVEECPERVQLSAGTVLAIPTKESPYQVGAVIPQNGWRNLGQGERDILMTATPPEGNDSVTILKMPSVVLEIFSGLREEVAKSFTREELQRLLPRKRCETLIEVFSEHARRLFQGNSADGLPSRFEGGFNIKPPNMVTTSQNAQGEIVGLHVDSWSRLPLNARHEAVNRICVNVGAEDRFFLVVNLPIHRVYEFVGQHRRQLSADRASGVVTVRSFFEIYPSYPVLRVRLRPGEAYIAPTDQLIHDGCTIGMSVPDITLQLRGKFSGGPIGKPSSD